jgi:hypothetical protein
MSPRTIFLSRLIGLYYLLVTLAAILHKQAVLTSVTRIAYDPGAAFLAGEIGVAIGLAIVLAHNVWSGGALPVVVTLMGWITLVKSLLFLFLPNDVAAAFFLKRLHYQEFYPFYMALCLVIGFYLTYGGFAPPRRS